MDMFVTFSILCWQRYSEVSTGSEILVCRCFTDVKKAPTKFQSALFILHCQLYLLYFVLIPHGENFQNIKKDEVWGLVRGGFSKKNWVWICGWKFRLPPDSKTTDKPNIVMKYKCIGVIDQRGKSSLLAYSQHARLLTQGSWVGFLARQVGENLEVQLYHWHHAKVVTFGGSGGIHSTESMVSPGSYYRPIESACV